MFTLLFAFQLLFNPESEILIVENFITPEISKTLIDFYDREKKELNKHTDNQITLSASTNLEIRKILSSISHRILQVMRENYFLNGKNIQIDHFALYARIAGNYCPYHADNTCFICPVHGRDPRYTCPGTCPGSGFMPNHTPWRQYTALLYLNDDFEGGEIAFEDGPCNKIYKKVIPIRSHLLVIAPNGPNFYHEVYRIRKGKRYSLHFWYTTDPNHFSKIL